MRSIEVYKFHVHLELVSKNWDIMEHSTFSHFSTFFDARMKQSFSRKENTNRKMHYQYITSLAHTCYCGESTKISVLGVFAGAEILSDSCNG